MRVLDGLWQVGGDVITTPEDAAVYLVLFGGEAVLIDAGCGKHHSKIVTNIQVCLPPKTPVTHIFLTHCHYDHAGGARKLAEKYGAQVIAHEAEAEWLEQGDNSVTGASWYGATMEPVRISRRITRPVERFSFGGHILTARHMPGHSPGSLVYTAGMEGKTVLFGQDVHGPVSPQLFSNAKDYRESLEKLLGLGADVLCEGHLGVFKGKKEVEKFIRPYLAKAARM
jgi:glyoxylase-like metal-dependent hydrolase (beta-lactamase superfamily II)